MIENNMKKSQYYLAAYTVIAIALAILSAYLFMLILNRMMWMWALFLLKAVETIAFCVILVIAIGLTIKKFRSRFFRHSIIALCFMFFLVLTTTAIFAKEVHLYIRDSHGRLGSSIDSTLNINEWLEEIEKSLMLADPNSIININDYRHKMTDERLGFAWKKGDYVESVLTKLDKLSEAKLLWSEVGNPHSLGPIHGSIYRVELFDRDDCNTVRRRRGW